MLSRFISRPSRLRFLTIIYSNNASLYSPSPPSSLPLSGSIQHYISKPDCRFVLGPSRYFSSNRKNNGSGNNNDPSSSTYWKISSKNDNEQSIFGDEEGNLAGITDDVGDFGSGVEKSSDVISQAENDSWSKDSTENVDIFADIDKEFGSKKEDGGDEWVTAEGYKPWSFADEGKEDVFDIGETFEGLPSVGEESLEREVSEADKHLKKEEQELSDVLKGPNRAFGDLIAASGITEAMLDSLIALKDLEHVEGLPPLREIEDMRLEKNESKSIRSEIERKKQEEIAKSRVRQVDEKGRAYGTGRRKCSIARVWIQPGDGKFLINDKHFDVYFPILDHRADLLRPFAETKTLGLWDVKCTVKGGGVSGQVGAVRLGISKALQNWEPGLRPYLKSAGFLTRDPRVVERKKPGKAKARKSFQWVKR